MEHRSHIYSQISVGWLQSSLRQYPFLSSVQFGIFQACAVMSDFNFWNWNFFFMCYDILNLSEICFNWLFLSWHCSDRWSEGRGCLVAASWSSWLLVRPKDSDFSLLLCRRPSPALPACIVITLSLSSTENWPHCPMRKVLTAHMPLNHPREERVPQNGTVYLLCDPTGNTIESGRPGYALIGSSSLTTWVSTQKCWEMRLSKTSWESGSLDAPVSLGWTWLCWSWVFPRLWLNCSWYCRKVFFVFLGWPVLGTLTKEKILLFFIFIYTPIDSENQDLPIAHLCKDIWYVKTER